MRHPSQVRYLAEDLVRLRRSDEQRRYAAPQRAAKIDANPHQIDAVIFALARLREGGCILADEVGLGKTIEAGLVIAQLMAEGARRVLLVAPKPLLGQWRQELYQLFDIDAARREPASAASTAMASSSSVARPRAARGAAMRYCCRTRSTSWSSTRRTRFSPASTSASTSWGTTRRTQQRADRRPRARGSRRTPTPVLLLTATPIQNSLTELWGLVQYVDPLGTLLGDLATFREVFCGVDDRQLAPGQEEELRSRLAASCSARCAARRRSFSRSRSSGARHGSSSTR